MTRPKLLLLAGSSLVALAHLRVPPDEDPLLSALADGRERHRTLTVRGLDGRDRHVEATLIPLVGQAGRVLGAFAIFWPASP